MSELFRYIPDEVGRNALDVGLKWVFYIPGPPQVSESTFHSFIRPFNKRSTDSSVLGRHCGGCWIFTNEPGSYGSLYVFFF